MQSASKSRLFRSRSLLCARAATMLLVSGAALLANHREAVAQSSGVQRPMPNVLLLVDTSGSMERMTDNTIPTCNYATGGESFPNRWGMLLQALTGNIQPFFNCAAVSRATTNTAFRKEYQIAGVAPYDTDYFLPYHRPLANTVAANNACAIGPRRLPGATPGNGVGPLGAGYSAAAGQGGDVRDFPDDALVTAKYDDMLTRYGASTEPTTSCIFDQAADGQLDAARDYVRFGMMTFDSDTGNAIGVTNASPVSGSVVTTAPFLGQWSYRRTSSNPDYSGTFPFSNGTGSSQGRPMNCLTPAEEFEVGARHWGAPPWEGRMVPFPSESADLLEIQKTNARIQRVLLATRPFGATPITAMLDDARDYLWYNDLGPRNDAYVRDAHCRDQYIVLLTDGAPNLDMRPACEGGVVPANGICPYPNKAASIASTLYADPLRKVTTFVIGFSVNGTSATGGDGFPSGYTTTPKNNCKAWYEGVGGTPTAMASACTPAPAEGTTAAACCALNEIAYAGSGGATAPAGNPATGPFFAESQADIVLSFGKILASITKSVATRTVPAYTPAAYATGSFGAGATTAQYLGSFIPNAQKPWSGEIRRERSVCTSVSGALQATPAAPNVALGDSMAVNLAKQSSANRLFVTFMNDKYSTPAPATDAVDSSRSTRPFYTAAADGVASTTGVEQAATDWSLKSVTDFRLALDIDKRTCKRGRAAGGATGTKDIPALDQDTGEACTDVVFGYTTAHVGAISKTGTIPGGGSGTYDFNLRCPTSGATPTDGRCSISGGVCKADDPATCPRTGEVCVPDCAPLGAVFRANPVIHGPPTGLLRDDGYRAFQALRAKRKPVLYAATTDGILHAFKALETAPAAHHELWSFIPPAVLPRLASNYPSGNLILLDGTPVVRDTIWDRLPADVTSSSAGSKWHSTLVAGLGADGGGYYAVNVTDSDCNAAVGSATNECAVLSGTSGYERPTTKGSLSEAGAGDYAVAGGPKRGPHFLWQLTDFPKGGASDPANVVRQARGGTDMVSLFGRQTGTPAITTLQVKIGADERQVGVAILPGGIDGTPNVGQTCPRKSTNADRVNDAAFPVRSNVRRWGSSSTGCDGDSVAGRGVTIVRLDNGQILRHFGRQQDVPLAVWSANVVTTTPFDSPMVGTPVVYPQTVGAVGQKVFIGDADGTLWRIDVSNTDPTKWKAALFADLVIPTGGSAALEAAASQPVQVTPLLSLDESGALVVNAATGDQENVIYRLGERNFVWSFLEKRPLDTTPATALVKWYETLADGARVTGPMTVFDKTLYFASFAPKIPASGQCSDAGVASLWGLRYNTPVTLNSPATGGAPLWCPVTSISTVTGLCNATTLTKNEAVTGAMAGAVIPGVVLRATQSCSPSDDLGDGTSGYAGMTANQYVLSYGVSKGQTASGTLPPAAMSQSLKRPLPRIATSVSSWALVVD